MEQRSPVDHLGKHAADAPNIHWCGVAGWPQQDLWSAIPQCHNLKTSHIIICWNRFLLHAQASSQLKQEAQISHQLSNNGNRKIQLLLCEAVKTAISEAQWRSLWSILYMHRSGSTINTTWLPCSPSGSSERVKSNKTYSFLRQTTSTSFTPYRCLVFHWKFYCPHMVDWA